MIDCLQVWLLKGDDFIVPTDTWEPWYSVSDDQAQLKTEHQMVSLPLFQQQMISNKGNLVVVVSQLYAGNMSEFIYIY